ncbi:hypothetical protein JCM10450v2_006592 [Rhodotorula kratochvilovae]
MPAQRSSSSSTSTPRAPSTASHASQGHPHLTLLAPEQAAPIPAYPSFKDRLHATNTWDRPSRAPTSPPDAPLPHTARSTSSLPLAASLSPKPRALSPLSATETPYSPPAAPLRARASSKAGSTASSSRASGSSGSSKTSWCAVRTEQGTPCARRSSRALDTNAYKDGQLHVVKQQAAREFLTVHPGAEVDGGRKWRRRGGAGEGRQGQVAKAVKTRRLGCVTGGGASSDEERVEVEVDLGKRLRVVGCFDCTRPEGLRHPDRGWT